MSNDEAAPPPPPSSAPPPPGPPMSPNGEGTERHVTGDVRRDNAIALAALVVALLGLLLSIIVIGGLIGIIAIVMARVGLKRSKETNTGRGFSIGAIVLSLMSIVASGAALAIVVTTLQNGNFDLDTLISNSQDNTEFPPDEDIVEVLCSEDGLALATIVVNNPTQSRQLYTLTISWESTTGEELNETFDSDVIAPGEDSEFRIFQRSSTAIVDSCSVSEVRRTVSLFE